MAILHILPETWCRAGHAHYPGRAVRRAGLDADRQTLLFLLIAIGIPAGLGISAFLLQHIHEVQQALRPTAGFPVIYRAAVIVGGQPQVHPTALPFHGLV